MISIQIQGLDVVANNLQRLPEGIRDRVLKKAIKAASQPIEDDAKQFCPVDFGVLKNSITTKVSSKGTKGNQVTAIIGPKTKVRVPKRIVTRGPHKGQVLQAIPTLYAHNVEFGHNSRGGTRVAPDPFMRGAWDSSGGEKALNNFADQATIGVVDEVQKLDTRNAISAANGVAPL